MRRYPWRFRWVVVATAGFFAIDQLSKLLATAFPPDHYVKNDSPGPEQWEALVPLLILPLFTHRLLLVTGSMFIGGGIGNTMNSWAWPGGVPDFIDAPFPFSEPSIWNVTDAFIVLGFGGFWLVFALAFAASHVAGAALATKALAAQSPRRRLGGARPSARAAARLAAASALLGAGELKRASQAAPR